MIFSKFAIMNWKTLSKSMVEANRPKFAKYLFAFITIALTTTSCFKKAECECFDVDTETITIVKAEGNCRPVKEGLDDRYPEGFDR